MRYVDEYLPWIIDTKRILYAVVVVVRISVRDMLLSIVVSVNFHLLKCDGEKYSHYCI